MTRHRGLTTYLRQRFLPWQKHRFHFPTSLDVFHRDVVERRRVAKGQSKIWAFTWCGYHLSRIRTPSMSKAQEAQQFLDDLESWTPATASPSVPSKSPIVPAGKPGEAADVIAFLDEITQKSSEPTRTTLLEPPSSRTGTPTLRKSTERVRMGAPSPLPLYPITPASPALSSSKTELPVSTTSASTATPQPPKDETIAQQKGWGWGGVSSVWSSASAAIQQAKTVVDEQVKNLPNNEQAKKWSAGALEYAKTAQEYAKTAQLDKLGASVIYRFVEITSRMSIYRAGLPAGRTIHFDRHSQCSCSTNI